MPAPTRKSARSAAAASKGQSTLSFNNRVSKSGAAKATGKDAAAAAATELESPIATPPPSKKAKIEEAEEAVVEPEDESQEVEDDKPEAEVRASKITDAQLRKYWKGVEEARLAKRVHQEELGLGEKVLRYFDISSQYGVGFSPFPFLVKCLILTIILQPCIGMPRMKRWSRAERLGLNPPIEVLAVLLKEKSSNPDVEKSAMDRLMSSTAIGSG